jgi:hypothetical protein
MTPTEILALADMATCPVYRGKQMTGRRVLNIGKAKYFWKGDEVGLVAIPTWLPYYNDFGRPCDYNCGLVNVYEAGGAIGMHCDTKKDMDVSEGVYTISYGITDAGTIIPHGTTIGTMWLDGTKTKIVSGEPLIFDGYNIKHRCTTHKNVKYRVNITLRKMN